MNRRYTKEEKLKFVLLLRQGKFDLSLTPEGVSRAAFSGNVRNWARAYEKFGDDGLERKPARLWTAGEKAAAASRILAGEDPWEVASAMGLRSPSQPLTWARKLRESGPDALKSMAEEAFAMGKGKQAEGNADQAELEYLRTENAYLKKLLELRRRAAPRGSGRKRKPSRN